MLCKWCQIKVARNCVMSIGGCVPLNALPCDFEDHCNVEEYSKRIIEIFQPERSKREDFRRCKYCENYYVKNKSIHLCDDCFSKNYNDEPIIAKPKDAVL